MWDFSWLERRWPGAGYEDWDLALDELVERGYNAVRIDAYPHLLSLDAHKNWKILPCWNQQDWGSPARNEITVQPFLNDFIRKCRDRGILVALSTWFQRDEEDSTKGIISPRHHARIWQATLDSIAADGLLDSILYLDFCNEWPFDCWAPFFQLGNEDNREWKGTESLDWINESIGLLRSFYPDIAYTYSHVGRLWFSDDQIERIRVMDFIEPHIWMVQANDNEFYKRIEYNYERFDPVGYENIVHYAQQVYDSGPEYWKRLLEQHIDAVTEEATKLGLPMITTECWGIVDYKDWPLLDWAWVKEICAHGVRYAASKGSWLAISTSNFCGPQFIGMWRDKEWHQELTKIIKSAELPKYDEPTGRWN